MGAERALASRCGRWEGWDNVNTGLREQKARNLEHRRHVALTTGNNTWAQGLDVVVEGTAVPVADRDALQRLADAYEAKYGSAWHFDVGDGVFGTGQDAAANFGRGSRPRSSLAEWRVR